MKYSFFQKLPADFSWDKTVWVGVGAGKKDEVFREEGYKKVLIGLGNTKERTNNLTRRKYFLLGRRMVRAAQHADANRIVCTFSDFQFKHLRLKPEQAASILAENMELAAYAFNTYKTMPPEGWGFVEEIIVVGETSAAVRKAFERGALVGQEVNATRELSNTPGGLMTPTILAERAREAANSTSVKVSVLNREDMEKLGMGGVLGVAQGSVEEPKFIIMEYEGGGKKKPVVLVGKGVTFDTGGINLKPSDKILGMNLDMSGGAAVIHTLVLAAKLKLKLNVMGLVPAVENMPSGSSIRPGDILRAMNGTTIEIINTDAEGRVILADALCYVAAHYQPEVVIDVATLTGAACVALGTRASALLSRDEQLVKELMKAGEESGDYVWPLPLWEEYEAEVKGNTGDVANAHPKGSRDGGAINGAMFLYQFAKPFKRWAHLDTAPRMEAAKDEYLADGAAGAPVRLLLKYLENLK